MLAVLGAKQERRKNAMTRNRKKQIQSQVRCPNCGAVAVMRPASEIYHDESRTDQLYVCSRYPACDSYVKAHPGTKTPMGPLANGDQRHLRILAHRSFDRLWQTGLMTRRGAYRWMADFFNIDRNEAHIGYFGEYRCR